MAALSTLRLAKNTLGRQTLAAAAGAQSVRYASSKSLHDTIEEMIPERLELAKKLKSEHGDADLGQINVSHVFGGMRGLKVMLWEPSVLDAKEGIRFWGKSIPECQKVLPTAPGGQEMLPEAMFFYLLTGKVPTEQQTADLTNDLAARSVLPSHIEKLIDAFPKTLHPMTQFVAATAALNHDSKFAEAYANGMKKSEYWKTTLEDCLDLCAKVYTIASRIYANTYGKGASSMPGVDKSKDLAWNFANQIGLGHSEGFIEVIRLYNSLHTDHEGGNVSAHTTHLVGSALADPFLSYAAGLAGLAGPLHGLANQEVLRFVLQMHKSIGGDTSPEKIKDELWKLLNSGRVLPGYGHAVLRQADPRFTALIDFGKRHKDVAENEIFKLVNALFEVAPGVLTEHGKTKNPFPNVDAGSGVLLHHYGLQDFKFYTVVFGTSRAMGVAAQLLWDRVLGLPIERPKSMSMEALLKIAQK